MSELADIYSRVGAARVLDIRVPERVRIALRSWASGVDQLARNSGAVRPESVASPSSWQTNDGSDETLATIRRWEAWYSPIAVTANLPPLFLWGNVESPSIPGNPTWGNIQRQAQSASAPSYVVAYLTAEGGRWSGFLADTRELPSLLSELTQKTQQADRRFRAWWAQRLTDRAWPRVTDSPAPAPRRRRRRTTSIGSFAGLAVSAVIGAVAAVAVLGRRRR